MSRVFLATETALGRAVVVKMLAPDLAAGVSAERFAREVKLAARLQQANIVPLLSAGEADGVPWYSMPFVRGESLRAKLASGAAMPLTDAIHVLRDVARALAFAHGEGVAHRDIKPENILLSGGAAVVTDFGIAKALTASRTEDGTASLTITQAGASIGTPAYMAPEQVAGDPETDHRADLYAWGLVAWELIAGKHPFADRKTATAMIAAQLSETPPVLTAVRGDIPIELSAIVASCLAKDPDRRPQSASELLAALDAVGTPRTQSATGKRRALSSSRVPAIAAVCVAVLAVAGWVATHRPSGEKSLAVLPFESVGGDTANVYFAEGMADELTTALTRVPGLHVAATSSSFSYRNTTADVRQVGKSLNVGNVLTGRVRREGTRMRVSAQLTSAADARVLWSNSYEREVKDAFAVQNEIASDIVNALRVTLTGAAGIPRRDRVHDTTDVDTYDLYLRGLYFLQQRGGGVARSVGYFQQALSRDSSFAPAWAQLGAAYGLLPLFANGSIDSLLPLARSAIARAHALDSLNADAYSAEGFAALLALDGPRARSAFARALSLDSSHAIAHRGYWGALDLTGHQDESVVQTRRMRRFDPLSPTTFAVAAIALLNANLRDSAVVVARRGFELDAAGMGFPRLAYALSMHAVGNVDSARALLKGAVPVPQTAAWMGYLLAATGDRAGAAAFLRQLETERGRNAFVNTAEAWTYLGGGDTTRALDALERAVRSREPIEFAEPFGAPAYDGIRNSARFAALIKELGLDPRTYRARSVAIAAPVGARRE